MYVRLPVFSSLSFHSLSYQWKGGKTRLVFVSSFKNVSIAAGETEKLVRFPVLLSKEQQAAALACLESTVLCIGFYGIPYTSRNRAASAMFDDRETEFRTTHPGCFGLGQRNNSRKVAVRAL